MAREFDPLTISDILETILGILTIVLVFLTLGLVALARRAETLLKKLIEAIEKTLPPIEKTGELLQKSVDVQRSLLRVQFLATVSTVDRTIEVQINHLTRKVEDVIFELCHITRDAKIETGVVEKELEVTYRLSYEETVYAVLEKSVDDIKCLPGRVYSELVS